MTGSLRRHRTRSSAMQTQHVPSLLQPAARAQSSRRDSSWRSRSSRRRPRSTCSGVGRCACAGAREEPRRPAH
eukprot:814223-Alexandrium_andersonii.AAC.1